MAFPKTIEIKNFKSYMNKQNSEIDVAGPEHFRERPSGYNFNVIGVGASAGGLEAIEKFFVGMPENTGAAFVCGATLVAGF